MAAIKLNPETIMQDWTLPATFMGFYFFGMFVGFVCVDGKGGLAPITAMFEAHLPPEVC